MYTAHLGVHLAPCSHCTFDDMADWLSQATNATGNLKFCLLFIFILKTKGFLHKACFTHPVFHIQHASLTLCSTAASFITVFHSSHTYAVFRSRYIEHIQIYQSCSKPEENGMCTRFNIAYIYRFMQG